MKDTEPYGWKITRNAWYDSHRCTCFFGIIDIVKGTIYVTCLQAEAKVKYANKRGALRDALSAITKPDTHYPPHHIRTDHLTDEMMGKARHLLKAVVNDDAVRSLPEAEPKSGERKLTKW